jgi:pimeloyl-ACP methyl ester carboxylesterase
MGLLKLLLWGLLVVVAGGTVLILRGLRKPPRYTYATALARRHPTHPGELGLTFVERRVELSPGVFTSLWVIDGSGPTDVALVLAHAYGESRYCVLRWLPALAQAAGKVVLYDLRAHGDSSESTGGLSLEESDDLIRLLDHLEWPGRFVLMGRSLGSGLALATAVRRPERVAGVAIEAAYRFGREPLGGYLKARGIPALPFTLLTDLYYTIRTGPPSKFDRAKWAAQLHCPLLVLHGAQDSVCGPGPAEQIANAAKAGKFVCFPESGHLDVPLKHADDYGRTLRQFVESLGEQERK